jgi:plasmid stabilization system protein ParE
LNHCLNRLVEAPGLGKPFSGRLPGVRAFRCRHHFIFCHERRETPLVIALLHERQDPVAKLAMRLDD